MPASRDWYVVMYDVREDKRLRRTHKVLRAWGFDGVVISDWTGIAELIKHGTARDAKHAAEKHSAEKHASTPPRSKK